MVDVSKEKRSSSYREMQQKIIKKRQLNAISSRTLATPSVCCTQHTCVVSSLYLAIPFLPTFPSISRCVAIHVSSPFITSKFLSKAYLQIHTASCSDTRPRVDQFLSLSFTRRNPYIILAHLHSKNEATILPLIAGKNARTQPQKKKSNVSHFDRSGSYTGCTRGP